MKGRDVIAPPNVDVSAVAKLVSLLTTTTNVEAYLRRTCELAADALYPPGSVSITVRGNGETFTVAASDELAGRVDETQYGTDEGPCLQALAEGSVIYCEDLGTEMRWGNYRVHALAQGVRSSLSLPLANGTATFGALNIYSREPVAFSAENREQASGFAAFAAGAISVARRMADQDALSTQLQEALNSRSVIDQALGIIMGQRNCDTETAFAVLRTVSANRHRKLRDVAATVVQAVTGKPPAPTPFSTRSRPGNPPGTGPGA